MVLGLSRNPEKYESRALAYERKGKTNKAIKNREKAARLRQHSGTGTTTNTGVPATYSTSTTTTQYVQRTPATYERNALKWEQRNNLTKAQKNREKVWRLNNPQYVNSTAPQFYQNNSFVGYSVPGYQPTSLPQTGGVPLSGGAANKGGLFHRTPEKYEARAAEYERKGKAKKAQKNREKAAKLRGNSGAYNGSGRNPERYNKNAAKWEQRGNWTKAQKNREKVWRLQNPNYGQYAAPNFYMNNAFVGYNHASVLAFNPAVAAPNPMFVDRGLSTMNTTTMNTVNMNKATHTTYVAPTVETHMHSTIVEQTSRPERIVEVQPVIHREIDAPQVRVVEKHMYETVPSTGPSVITKGTIVEETVRPRIIEEIQPVVHREVPAPFVERVEQHVTEHITKPTTTTKEVLNAGAIQTGLVQQTTTTTTTATTGGVNNVGMPGHNHRQ